MHIYETWWATLSCRRQSPWICGVFCLVWLRPRFVLLRCFLCRRNANLAGRFACRRCCRVSFFCVFFPMVCLVCEAKGFHTFCTLFYRFSHCQDRALERDRPQQRKKKLKPRASCTPKFQQGSTVTNLQVHPCWNYKLRVPVSLAFSWCQYILRDVASARPRGASKRLDWKLSKPFITERERL